MSRFRRSSIAFTDRDIELLFKGLPTESKELAELEPLVATLIDLRDVEPPADAEHMATALAAVARSSAPTRRAGSRRLVALAATVGLFFAMAGVALAADGAAPGDLLYPVDRAFERIGILDGGIEERIAEFDTLMSRGEGEKAFQFLEEVIEEYGGAEAGKAQDHLEAAVAETNEQAASAQEKVVALRDFIEENRGPGVGLDGRDFGQGVASIASGKEPTEQGPPEHAGPKDEPGPAEHAGAKDEPGQPEHAGPKDDQATGPNNGQQPGPPENAGPPEHAGSGDGPPEHAGSGDGPPEHAGSGDGPPDQSASGDTPDKPDKPAQAGPKK